MQASLPTQAVCRDAKGLYAQGNRKEKKGKETSERKLAKAWVLQKLERRGEPKEKKKSVRQEKKKKA